MPSLLEFERITRDETARQAAQIITDSKLLSTDPQKTAALLAEDAIKLANAGGPVFKGVKKAIEEYDNSLESAGFPKIFVWKGSGRDNLLDLSPERNLFTVEAKTCVKLHDSVAIGNSLPKSWAVKRNPGKCSV